MIRQIDKGAFGQVFLAKDKKTQENVAIKKFFKQYSTLEECLNLREVKSLR
jgi:serine/threonine protein kinase